MRLWRTSYTGFKRISTSLDDLSSVDSYSVFMLNNVPMMDLELKENYLDIAKKLINFMFFQNQENLNAPEKNSDSMRELIKGKNEREIVKIVLYKLNSLYGEDSMPSRSKLAVKSHCPSPCPVLSETQSYREHRLILL